MEHFRRLFPRRSRASLLCMLHLPALPGSPAARFSPAAVADRACREAETYLSAMGESAVDGFVVENMGDLPYVLPRDLGPETTAVMAVVCDRLRQNVVPRGLPIGVQVLAGANREAVAVAAAAGLQFVRAEGFVFGHVADEGWIDACAGPLLRYRRQIGADQGENRVAVFCDIKKKHSAHAVTADVSLEETAKAAEFFSADGVIVTGAATGREADPEEVARVAQAVDIPVLVGSGVNKDNVREFASWAHGLIVGSYFKKGGDWRNELDKKRLKDMSEALNQS